LTPGSAASRGTEQGYALALNLAIWINDEKRGAMTDAGWDISPYQGN
jgi:hypothetical protein